MPLPYPGPAKPVSVAVTMPGETISTAFVESTVNQVISKRFAKKQQMQWTPRGVHLLLQTRTRVLDGTLEHDFRRWYPRLSSTPANRALAA